MANIAQSVNVLGPLSTKRDGSGVIKQTLWWPLLLFSKYMRGKTIGVHLRSGEYEGRTKPAWVRMTENTPWLDVSCALSDDGFMNLAVVNISEHEDHEAQIIGVGEKEVQVLTVGKDNESVSDTNFDGVQRVGFVESKWDGQEKYSFPKHSLSLLRWKA